MATKHPRWKKSYGLDNDDFAYILIFIAMIPTLGSGMRELGELSFLYAFIFWSHVTLGTVAEILGVTVISLWVSAPLSNLTCTKMKKIMTPIFIIWTISLINGALTHILELA